jgi:hypothetical protein
MSTKNEKTLDNLLNQVIEITFYEDCKYKNEEEFDSIKQYLIDAIQDIEYIEQYEDDADEEE